MGDQSLIACVDEVVEDFHLRAFRNSHELREFSVSVTSESFRDVSWSRSHGIAQLFGELELTTKSRREQEQINAELELVCQAPGVDLSEIGESGHTTTGATALPKVMALFHAEMSLHSSVSSQDLRREP